MEETQRDTPWNEPKRRGGGVPRWVTVFAISGALLIALLLAVMVFGGGQHSPARHLSLGDTAGACSSSAGWLDTPRRT